MGWVGVGILIATACYVYYRNATAVASPEPTSEPAASTGRENVKKIEKGVESYLPRDEERENREAGGSDGSPASRSQKSSEAIAKEPGIEAKGEPEPEPAEESQTTPKALPTGTTSIPEIPTLCLDNAGNGGSEDDAVLDDKENGKAPHPQVKQSGSISVPAAVEQEKKEEESSTLPNNVPPSLLMPPPPRPQPTPQQLQQRPTNSLNNNINRNNTTPPTQQPRPPTTTNLLKPPPSTASSLRAPPTTNNNNTLKPPTSNLTVPAKPKPKLTPNPKTKPASRRVLLDPGYSPLDWAALTSNPANNLRGANLPSRLIRVTPSMLKAQNGRRGTDAWTLFQGKVYNITPYLPFHPGGKGELMRGAGRDAGRLFFEVHPWVNWDAMLGECLVGILVAEGEGEVEGGIRENHLDAMD